jgi:CheY-like chemotaxis protein
MPEVILADMRMPGMNGLRVRSRVSTGATARRADRARDRVEDVRALAEEIGAGYVQKPVDLDALLTAIERCLRLAG